jgi:hypothetical protein
MKHRQSARVSRAASEALEQRMLLTLSPAGGEFLVNTTVAQTQAGAAAAMDADGDFVVAWHSYLQDGSSWGVYAQRYNAAGVVQGGEFRVNTYTTGFQANPAVAINALGDFVVAWSSIQDGDGYGIYAQRYNAVGVKQGVEFQVNTHTTGSQAQPCIAMDVAGNFVIAWQAGVQDGGTNGIYARRYNAAGVAQGSEFRANTYTTSQQNDASVGMDGDGDFVIAWNSYGQDGSGYGVYAQRYDAAGVVQGVEFRVNSHTTANQNASWVAMDQAGNFVVTWESTLQDGSGDGIYAQRYNAAGVAQGVEFRVNTYTTVNQERATAAMDDNGDFVVTWGSNGQDGSSFGVYAQAYNAAGVAQGTEFKVNTFTNLIQQLPSIGMNAAGDFVVAWQSDNGQDGGSGGVFAQRYDESTDTAGPIIGGVFVNGKQAFPYSMPQDSVSQIVVGFSEAVRNTPGPSNVTNLANWRVTHHDGTTISNVPVTSIVYGFNAATNRHEATLNLSTAVTAGTLQVMAFDNLQDLAGNALDGNLDGTVGGSAALTFGIGAMVALEGEFQVNSFTTNAQNRPAIGMDADGDFVVAWDSYQDASSYGIYAQRYNSAGLPQGAEFRVNSFTTGDQLSPAIGMDADGDFVVAWESQAQDGSNRGIYAQRYNALGVAQGGEVLVNTFTTNEQRFPAIGMDADGDFIVVWQSDTQDGSSNGIYAQRYNALGVAQGGEFRVNSFTTDAQSFPAIGMDADGDFVVTWIGNNGSGFGVNARRYNAAGVAQGTEFRVNTFTTGFLLFPEIGMDADGDFVVAWQSTSIEFVGYGIYAQRYNASGVPQGGEFQVNTSTAIGQAAPAIRMDADGEFVVAWQRHGEDGSSYGIYAQRYNAAGVPQGADFRVNSFTTGHQFSPAIGMDADGDFIVAWQSKDQDGSSYGVYAQRYNLPTAPIITTLSDSPDPAIPGAPVTLTASGVSDDVIVLSMRFYREDNGIPGLQFGADGDSLLATDTAVGGGWNAIVSTAGVAPGTYTYYAQASDAGGLLSVPASTTHTIVDAAPLITDALFHFDTGPQRLTFTFDQNVSASLSEIDFTSIGAPGADYIVSWDENTNSAIVTFTDIIADGNYTATVVASGVTSPFGMPMDANYQLPFFFLGGDADHDRDVDVNDLGILASNWQQSPRTFSQGDFDYSGTVDVNDLGMLASHWQQQLAAPSPPSIDAARRAARSFRLIDQVTL